MNNNLPAEINNNIFKRFINFIKNIFIKTKEVDVEKVLEKYDKINEKENIEPTKEFLEEIRINGIEEKAKELIDEKLKKEKMKEIINIIENNPEKLEELDVQKLETINNYYDEKILELDREIEELKTKLAS